VPELPEVETTRRGIEAHLVGRRLEGWTIRNAALRWPVRIPDSLQGQRVHGVGRRAKYLLIRFDTGALILHLGMSGSLRVLPSDTPLLKHDHVDLLLDDGRVLRFNDPRRFGSIHWQPEPVMEHWLLRALGPEPISDAFSGAYLKTASRLRKVAVKNFLMDSHVVVGVGNIYANEALFMAGIRPSLRANRVTLASYEHLAHAVRKVLQRAIVMGGTTLRDFVNQDGEPGYFKQSLYVYGRGGQPCKICETPLKAIRIGQRATVFCPKCQRSQGLQPHGC
jgi:formamidopyrimidine-DNA glycosylase